MTPALFLDRDGTVIEHVHHLVRHEDVRLIRGAAAAIRLAREHGFKCVVVTNQSVVGRGMLTEAGLAEVHREMERQLAESNAAVDAIYYCPAAPSASGAFEDEHPERKPRPGMLLRAAGDQGIDLSQSWMVGDTKTDIDAGINAGCAGQVLVRTGLGASVERDDPQCGEWLVAPDLLGAVEAILERVRNRSVNS